MGGACVEVAWRRSSYCANGACVEVSTGDGRVLVRDSKLGDESPVIEFTPSEWRSFLVVAQEWDRTSSVLIQRLQLMHTQGIGTDLPVCISYAADSSQPHLHFTWEEWSAFCEGVKADEFNVEAFANKDNGRIAAKIGSDTEGLSRSAQG